MTTKLNLIVREFLLLKSKTFKFIEFIKVYAHQDDVKSFEELSFLEQLNAKYDFRDKVLTINMSEEVIISFPLVLSSPYVMIATNQLIFNYPKDIRLHAHLIKCEEQLRKVLKSLTLAQ